MEEQSRSQIKREMLALQKLGERLTELPPDQLRTIEMPAELREAVLELRAMRKHEARRRQVQHIGVLMRRADPEPIRRALEATERGHHGAVQSLKQVEAWRDKLIAGDDDLLENLLERFPQADHQQFGQLVRNARKELELSKPPKHARVLFRFLRDRIGTA
jgi:ribosome-associated protein